MKLERRERTLLAVLGVVLLVFLGFRLGPLLGSLTGGDGEGGLPSFEAAAQGEVEQLQPLSPELHDYRVERNPFHFYEPPPPPPPPRPRIEPRPQPPPPPPREPEPDPGPQPPVLSFSYLGSFGPREGRIGVLTDAQGGLYNVRVGDEVGDVVRVANIGYESIDLQYLDFPDLPAVRLEVGP